MRYFSLQSKLRTGASARKIEVAGRSRGDLGSCDFFTKIAFENYRPASGFSNINDDKLHSEKTESSLSWRRGNVVYLRTFPRTFCSSTCLRKISRCPLCVKFHGRTPSSLSRKVFPIVRGNVSARRRDIRDYPIRSKRAPRAADHTPTLTTAVLSDPRLRRRDRIGRRANWGSPEPRTFSLPPSHCRSLRLPFLVIPISASEKKSPAHVNARARARDMHASARLTALGAAR